MDELHVLLATDNHCIYADESIPSVSIKNITPETSLLSIIIPLKQNKTSHPHLCLQQLTLLACLKSSPIPS